jgi:hypothetical protein
VIDHPAVSPDSKPSRRIEDRGREVAAGMDVHGGLAALEELADEDGVRGPVEGDRSDQVGAHGSHDHQLGADGRSVRSVGPRQETWRGGELTAGLEAGGRGGDLRRARVLTIRGTGPTLRRGRGLERICQLRALDAAPDRLDDRRGGSRSGARLDTAFRET